MEVFFGKLITFLKVVLPALVGSAISVYSAMKNKDIQPPITIPIAIFLLFCGGFLGYNSGLAAAQYLAIGINTPIIFLTQFFIGVIGMGAILEIKEQVPSIIKSASDSIKAWFNRKLGG